MVNSKTKKSDITIIGGGPGGYVAAIRAAQLGADVVLIEKEDIGGTCLNWGCIPTKALVRSAEVYKEIKDARQYGLKVDSVDYDLKNVMRRKKKIVTRLVKGVEYLLRKNNVEVINGKARIEDPDTVSVEEKDLDIKSDNIIIATGSKISKLPIEGVDLPGVIFSREALALQEMPEKMVIVGAGIIGMEFASIFANFGVDVSVVEYMDRILPGIDPDLAKEMTRAAKKKKIDIHTGARVEEIREEKGENIVLFSKNDEKQSVRGEKVLMAVGREPDFGGIDVRELGIELNDNKRGIKVNKKMETNITGIYAIGDVTDEILLAHVASHQGIVAVENIMGKDKEMHYEAVPSAIFTDPEIATVGIDEPTAKKEGIEYEIGRFPFSANGKVLTTGEMTGFIKLIKEKNTGTVIGAAIIGVHATDLIAEMTLAVRNKLTTEDIIETIHAHPTTAEVVHEAALDAEGGALHYI